jgi:hypothetical protein
MKSLVLLAPLLVAPIAIFTQTVGADLQGTVKDPAGIGIPNAAVEIRNVETGISRNLRADGGGRWHESAMQPGEYEIHIQAPNFRTFVRQGVHMAVGQQVRSTGALSNNWPCSNPASMQW